MTYDEIQMDTELRACPGCQRDLFLRRPHMKCSECRAKDGPVPVPLVDVSGNAITGP